MPATVDAALIFGVLVLPGYLLGQGIEHGRKADTGRPDLHVLAKAVVASLIWLFLTYWWGVDDLISWVDEDTLGDHSVLAGLWRASVLVVAPYFVGRFLGRSVDRSTRLLARPLRWLGIASPFQTPWDLAWEQVKTAPAGVLVTMSLDDGRKIAGQFVGASLVSVSPEAREVYLAEAYETTSTGELIVYDRGAHIDGAKIAAVAFQTFSADEDQGTPPEAA